VPVFVFIWEQNMYRNQRVKGHTWPGHTSINIGKKFDKEFDASAVPEDANVLQMLSEHAAGLSRNYVSWWPGGTNGGFGAGAVFKKSPRARKNVSLTTDIVLEGYLPDHVIRLDATAGQKADMLAAWAEIRQKPKATYGSFRKNCSTIASRVLHAGGYLGHKWALNNNWVWAPSDILKLALSAGGTRMKWRDLVPLLTGSGIRMADYGNIRTARSGRYCTCGVPVDYQQDGYDPNA
jgi:hypothetical protein